MKKIILALLTLLLSFNLSNILTVKADSAKFYEAEYIDNIYIKYQGNGMIYYQKARFFRRVSDNIHAYCLEPFVKINESLTYESQINPSTISSSTWKKISLIAHFGYKYKNHTDSKWYAITQVMIWKEIEPNANFVFTDTLNGNPINPYQNEINEINNLIKNYQTKPSFNNNTITLIEDQTTKISDNNNVLSNYKIATKNFTISNNDLVIPALKEGDYKIELNREDKTSNDPPIFYYNNSSQNIMTSGYAEKINSLFSIKVISTSIKINKIDYDTKSTKSSGNGKLIGTEYDLFDSNMNKITTLVIDDTFSTSIKNLPFGKYYLKEIIPGTGYTLDPNIYDITIDKEHPNIELTLENEIIKKTITISKSYGNNSNFNSEAGASFDIYDMNNNYIKSITTDTDGKAQVILSFGKYKFRQTKSKDGYQKVNDFDVIVSNSNDDKLLFELYDYEIEVPNTYSNKSYLFIGLYCYV